MMKIAICDDDISFVSNLKYELYNYSNSHNLEPVIDCFYSGEEIIKTTEKYNLIILDYQMDQLNGLDTARKIRKGINKFACIIFLTNFPEVAIPAYEVDTYRFVVKDTLYQGIFDALDNFRNIKKENYDIAVKTKLEWIVINTENIIYFESQNKDIYIHLLDNQTISTKMKLSSFYNMVPHTHFVQIHKSYVVNLNHIQLIHNTSLKLKRIDFEIPLSRNYKSEFMNKYHNYISES